MSKNTIYNCRCFNERFINPGVLLDEITEGAIIYMLLGCFDRDFVLGSAP